MFRKTTPLSRAAQRATPAVLERLENRQLFNGGALDASFGNGGFSTHFNFQPLSVAVQADGKTVVVGEVNGDLAVGRVNANGTADTVFGTRNTGVVLTSFGNGETMSPKKVVIQSDGKILVAGTEFDSNGEKWALARYNSDGSLDSSYGNNGIETVLGYNSYAGISDLALQPNGEIVFSASRYNGHFFSSGTGEDICVCRLQSDGALDGTFGDPSGSGKKGYVTTDFNSTTDYPEALSIMPDGRIVVGGITGNGGAQHWIFARYNFNGTLDSSFANGGTIKSGPSGSLMSMAVTPDGQIYAAGLRNNAEYIAHYSATGQFDVNFGNGGVVPEFPGQAYSPPVAVFLPAPGKILVVGGYGGIDAIQLNSNGSLDPTFGNNGEMTISTSPATADNTGYDANLFYTYAAAETGTGQIMIAARTNYQTPETTLARMVEETPIVSVSSTVTHGLFGVTHKSIVVSRDQAYDFPTEVNLDIARPASTTIGGATTMFAISRVVGTDEVEIPAGSKSVTITSTTPGWQTVTAQASTLFTFAQGSISGRMVPLNSVTVQTFSDTTVSLSTDAQTQWHNTLLASVIK